MAAVLVVCQGVLPALRGPLMAHEADEGRAPDDVGGGGGAQKSVEGGEALGRPGPPRRATVAVAAGPAKPVQHLFWSSKKAVSTVERLR